MNIVVDAWSFTRSTPEAVKNVRAGVDDADNLGTDRSTRVVYCLMARAIPVVLRGGLEDVEIHHFPWAHLQNTGRISASVTVIWS